MVCPNGYCDAVFALTCVKGLVFVVNMPSNPLTLPSRNTSCSIYVIIWTLVAASSVFSVPIIKLCNMLPLVLGSRSLLRRIEKKSIFRIQFSTNTILWGLRAHAYLNGPSKNSRNSKMTDRRPSNSMSGSSRASKFNAAPIIWLDSSECTTKLYTRNVFF